MKGFKAFNKGLICRGKQYTENEVFEEENAEICKIGMHFCKNPLDTLDYYPLIDDNGNMTEFAEVEALDDVKTDDNKKYCTKKLKVGAKLTLPQFIKASVDVLYENIKTEVEEETNKIKNSGGDNATLAGGNWATLAGGYNSLMIGDNGSMAKGKRGAVILLVERDKDYNITNFNAVQVDGEKIKEDTFCRLENGEFVEVQKSGE